MLCVFWLYSDTPIIKASGRELSCLLLLGTLVSFVMTFAIIARPNTQTCTITRFGIGLCYTLCYAALVTKTNRIHRIFNNATSSPHKPRYVFCFNGLHVIFIFQELLYVLESTSNINVIGGSNLGFFFLITK